MRNAVLGLSELVIRLGNRPGYEDLYIRDVLRQIAYVLTVKRSWRSKYSKITSIISEELGTVKEMPISGRIPATTPENTGEDSSGAVRSSE